MSMTDPTASTLGSQLASIVEAIWSKVQAFALLDASDPVEVPDVVCITGSGIIGTGSRFSIRLAHVMFDTWERDEQEGRMHELFVSGESFGLGAEDVLISILHEATHVVNRVKGVEDVTRGGQYHNRKFASSAARWGLEWAHQGSPSDNQGFSDVTLSELGRIFWADELAALDEQVRAAASIKRGELVKMKPEDPKDPRWTLKPVETLAPVKTTRRQRNTYTCGCADVRMFADDFARCQPSCASCGHAFG
jgi:hypothetical protein